MPETLRFARRVFVRVKPESREEFLRAMKESVYPRISKERGVRRIYLLRDVANPNEFVSLTLWNSRKYADSYENSGHFREYVELIADKLQEPVSINEFVVEHHEVSASTPPPKRLTQPARKKKRSRK